MSVTTFEASNVLLFSSLLEESILKGIRKGCLLTWIFYKKDGENSVRFEREINIYGDEAVLKRFKTNETSISVVQGKLSALISESELVELENSNATMYSKLASAVMKIDSLELNFSDLTTKYNTVSGQYTSLDSKVATYKASVDGLSANISTVQQNLSKNYSTTAQMNLAINAKANSITASVSSTYATKSSLNSATGRISSLETWKNEASLKITDSAIVATVTSSSAWEGKADKGKLIAQINLSSESATIKASKIKLEGLVTANSNFKILTDGSIVAKNGTFTGSITGSKITGSDINFENSEGTIKINADGFHVKNNSGAGLGVYLTPLDPFNGPYLIIVDEKTDGTFCVQAPVKDPIPTFGSQFLWATNTSIDFSFSMDTYGISFYRGDNSFILSLDPISKYEPLVFEIDGIRYCGVTSERSKYARCLNFVNNSGVSYGEIVTITKTYTFDVSESDARLKKNIDICTTSALDKIDRIAFYQFDYKNGGHQDIGVITQQLKTVDEKFIRSVGQKDIRGNVLDTMEQPIISQLVFLLLKAVQELSDKYRKIESEVSNTRNIMLLSELASDSNSPDYMLEELRELSKNDIIFPKKG